MGLTLDEKNAREQSLAPYPHLQRWLREDRPVEEESAAMAGTRSA